MRALPTCLIVAAALLLAIGPARADEDRARQHFSRGQALYVVGSYADAGAEFDRGFVEAPERVDFLDNAARAYQLSGQRNVAAARLQRYLELRPDAADRGDIERRIVELRSEQHRSPPPLVARQAPERLHASPPARPIYRRWWFYVAVGAVAVAGAAAGIAAATIPRDADRQPSTAGSYAASF